MTRCPPEQIVLHLATEEDLHEFAAWVYGQPDDALIACDTETTGLQPFGFSKDRVRMVQFANENEAWALPVHTYMRNHIQLALWWFAGRLVGHNSIFDESMLRSSGFDPGPPWDDTYIAHHLTHPTDYHGLKSVAGQFYGYGVRAGEKWLDAEKKRNGWDWGSVPVQHEAYWGYGAMDAALTSRLATDLLPVEFTPQYEREVRIAHQMKRMAARGLPVDRAYVADLRNKWDVEKAELKEELDKYQIENPNSGKQVAAALLNQGWEPDADEYTATGNPSVARAILEKFDHEIADRVLRYRRLVKYDSAYAGPMLASSGRLYPLISSLRATTGRMSVEGGTDSAPLHQFPKGPEVRTAIKADDGLNFYAIDYTGQEMRLICAFAEDDGLTHEVLEGGDVHGRIADELFGDDYTKEQRGWCKNALYAYAYGAQEKRLAATAHAPLGETEKAIARAFPGLAGFSERVQSIADQRYRDDGFAWAWTYGRRKVGAPKSRHYALSNYIMQGSGVDMIKEALVKIDEAGLDEHLRFVMHDELLLNLPPDTGVSIAEQVRQLMYVEFRGIPFEAHVSGPGKNWGEVS